MNNDAGQHWCNVLRKLERDHCTLVTISVIAQISWEFRERLHVVRRLQWMTKGCVKKHDNFGMETTRWTGIYKAGISLAEIGSNFSMIWRWSRRPLYPLSPPKSCLVNDTNKWNMRYLVDLSTRRLKEVSYWPLDLTVQHNVKLTDCVVNLPPNINYL